MKNIDTNIVNIEINYKDFSKNFYLGFYRGKGDYVNDFMDAMKIKDVCGAIKHNDGFCFLVPRALLCEANKGTEVNPADLERYRLLTLLTKSLPKVVKYNFNNTIHYMASASSKFCYLAYQSKNGQNIDMNEIAIYRDDPLLGANQAIIEVHTHGFYKTTFPSKRSVIFFGNNTDIFGDGDNLIPYNTTLPARKTPFVIFSPGDKSHKYKEMLKWLTDMRENFPCVTITASNLGFTNIKNSQPAKKQSLISSKLTEIREPIYLLLCVESLDSKDQFVLDIIRAIRSYNSDAEIEISRYDSMWEPPRKGKIIAIQSSEKDENDSIYLSLQDMFSPISEHNSIPIQFITYNLDMQDSLDHSVAVILKELLVKRDIINKELSVPQREGITDLGQWEYEKNVEIKVAGKTNKFHISASMSIEADGSFYYDVKCDCFDKDLHKRDGIAVHSYDLPTGDKVYVTFYDTRLHLIPHEEEYKKHMEEQQKRETNDEYKQLSIKEKKEEELRTGKILMNNSSSKFAYLAKGFWHYQKDDLTSYYVMNNEGSFNKNTIMTSRTLKRVERSSSQCYSVEDYYPLMDQYFVVHKGTTVIPYPIKYLREIVNAAYNKKRKDLGGY